MSEHSPATASPDHASDPAVSGRDGRQARGKDVDALSWTAVLLAITSGLALAAMLITKWIVGGGEIWPWFTRYALVAFPLCVILLVVSVVRNAVRRART